MTQELKLNNSQSKSMIKLTISIAVVFLMVMLPLAYMHYSITKTKNYIAIIDEANADDSAESIKEFSIDSPTKPRVDFMIKRSAINNVCYLVQTSTGDNGAAYKFKTANDLKDQVSAEIFLPPEPP